jgi:hypothetical protein
MEFVVLGAAAEDIVARPALEGLDLGQRRGRTPLHHHDVVAEVAC